MTISMINLIKICSKLTINTVITDSQWIKDIKIRGKKIFNNSDMINLIMNIKWMIIKICSKSKTTKIMMITTNLPNKDNNINRINISNKISRVLMIIKRGSKARIKWNKTIINRALIRSRIINKTNISRIINIETSTTKEAVIKMITIEINQEKGISSISSSSKVPITSSRTNKTNGIKILISNKTMDNKTNNHKISGNKVPSNKNNNKDNIINNMVNNRISRIISINRINGTRTTKVLIKGNILNKSQICKGVLNNNNNNNLDTKILKISTKLTKFQRNK